MEPLDPAKNDDTSGFSKRRISSILKAPRKSIRFSDQEQLENPVEFTKPLERRNSRRVSFAPANDVLLFSKDVKNVSPARSPLQELVATAATTENRVQMVVTEKGIQEIAGMETLLNAPLHTSQQRHKVNFEDDYGEKAVMFTTDDAFMDLTRNHMINTASDLDSCSYFPRQNTDTLPACGENTMVFTAGDASMDVTQCHTVNITGYDLDLGFTSFLASLSKPSVSGINPAISRMAPTAAPSKETSDPNAVLAQIKTQRNDVDKENQASLFLSSMMEKPVAKSRKSGDLFNKSAVCPEDADISMDMTQAQTGHILGFTGAETLGSSSVKVVTTTDKRVQMLVREEGVKTLLSPPLHASQQRHKVNFDSHDDCREKTVVFAEDDAFMDITQAHTVNIASNSQSHTLLPHQNSGILHASETMDFALMFEKQKNKTCDQPSLSVQGLDPGFKDFLASLFKSGVSSANPAITRTVPAAPQSKETVSPKGSGVQLKTQSTDMDKEHQTQTSAFFMMEKPVNITGGRRESSVRGAICPEDDVSMDMTEAQTGYILGFTATEDHLQCLFPTKDAYQHSDNRVSKTMKTVSLQQRSEALGSSNRKGAEPRMNVPSNASQQKNQVTCDYGNDHREKTMMLAVDEATDVVASGSESQLVLSQNWEVLPTCGEKTVVFTGNDASMDISQSHTVNITSDLASRLLLPHQTANILSTCGSKELTVKTRKSPACGMPKNRSSSAHGLDLGFKNLITSISKSNNSSANSVTTNVLTAASAHPQQTADSNSYLGQLKTQKANLDNDSEAQHFVSSLMEKPQYKSSKSGDSPNGHTLCPEEDVIMDMTEAKRGHILRYKSRDEHPQAMSFYAEPLKTADVDDDCMDMTESHTVNIGSGSQSQNCELLPTCRDQTMVSSVNDASMDMTWCHTEKTANDSVSQSFPSYQNVLFTCGNMDLSVKRRKSVTSGQPKNRSSLAHGVDLGFKNFFGDFSKPTDPSVDATEVEAAATPSPQETIDTNGSQVKTHKADVDHDSELPHFVSATVKKPLNETNKNGDSFNVEAARPEDDVSMDMTVAQTAHILVQTCTDKPPPCLSPTCDVSLQSDNLKKRKMYLQQQSSEVLGSCSPNGMESPKRPASLDRNESKTIKDLKLRDGNCSFPQRLENSVDGYACIHDAELPSKTVKNRRLSLADLQSKVRRLSHIVNETTPDVAVDSCTVPFSEVEHYLDEKPVKTSSLPVGEPELEMGLADTEDKTQPEDFTQSKQQSITTTPFNVKTTRLMSRLSMGGFLPKFPQRSKPTNPNNDSTHAESMEEHMRTNTIALPNHLGIINDELGNINDEVLGSDENLSEMVDTEVSQEISEKQTPCYGFIVDQALEDDVFVKTSPSVVHGKKRPLPEDQADYVEDEKRIKPSTDVSHNHDSVEMGIQSRVMDCDSNITTALSVITQMIDSSTSSNTTSIKCEATFESTLKQSLFESQLEDCSNDVQKKLDDGSITVLEFFKLFNLDFVIHNPRQSIVPGKLASAIDYTPMDLLKDRHINRPKQMVYESNLQELTEKVEGLKGRKRDLEKPLMSVNRRLWEEMRGSSEEELRSFGTKLKERNNFFRKMSKVQSHEMKEVLYSNLVQATLGEQQKLKGKLKEADEVLKNLDVCISELETELAAVEVNGSEDKPSLKSQQLEMERVTQALADNNRQMSELEMQNKQNLNKVKRLEAERGKLESHISMLDMLNEWKFGETRDNSTVYTFLHDTLHLVLVYEKSDGNDANKSERKVSHITFKRQLDDEKSQCHAHLVHTLLSQYFEGETAWVEKYPTSTFVPKLLHDVGLIVSRCRLLGEELRLLKLWGGLRLNILDISCTDTRVHVVFSSLKAFCKFEITFAVSLIHHLCDLQVQSFKNVIGSTTLQQIEEIVASFAPAKNLLTKIVKKIHNTLLC
ncbi:hypothetical protein LDENG_00098430 [Lucifuga dentata]|nr:hypothetical protein LDENG_00098430 [Lucifuga dentata]